MEKLKLGDMEKRMAQLIWEKHPLSSRALTELCATEFNWKRTTTYTMLARLCERGIFENQGGTVVALISNADFIAEQGEQFIGETFGGSLPEFIAAFTRRGKLSTQEVAEIRQLIDEFDEVAQC